MGDPESLEIVVELLSADAVHIKAGALASISALGIEEQRVRVDLDFDKATLGEAARRLGHDYRVFVQITVAEVSDVILVPLGALFRNENRWSTYVVANGRAKLRTLEIGNRDQLRPRSCAASPSRSASTCIQATASLMASALPSAWCQNVIGSNIDA